MKKLFALALCVVSFAAQAQWTLVTDSKSGDRLLVGNGTFDINKNEHGVWVAGATFVFVTNGVFDKPFEVAIDASSCDNGGGEMALNENGVLRKQWWANGGTKMFDIAGQVICAALGEAKAAVIRQTPRKAPTNVRSGSTT